MKEWEKKLIRRVAEKYPYSMSDIADEYSNIKRDMCSESATMSCSEAERRVERRMLERLMRGY